MDKTLTVVLPKFVNEIDDEVIIAEMKTDITVALQGIATEYSPCLYCGKGFKHRTKTQLFCCGKCRVYFHRVNGCNANEPSASQIDDGKSLTNGTS